ncbi:NADH dehydrogenase [ubiquinone] 1 beta subcomplex subunit 4 [Gryllus bimaculatus]|nr:NADH dehydrogenase [ubiquinone] 1 beta subcomplex subunit 4 [Gryllus bimaculatus]
MIKMECSFDSGIQRFMSMRTTMYDHFRPTTKATGYGFALLLAPLVLYTWLLKSSRDSTEKLYRTGQVAYRDRNFKFQ